MTAKRYLIYSALGLEATGWLVLFSGLPRVLLLSGFVVFHGLASMLLVRAITRPSPAHRDSPGKARRLVLWCVAFFIPVVGMLTLLGGLRYRAGTKGDDGEEDYLVVEEPELPDEPPNTFLYPLYGAAGLVNILRNTPGAQRRAMVVNTTRQLPGRDAVRLLRVALEDSADEVRRIASSMIDTRTQAIDGQIQDLERQLEDTRDTAARAQLHKAISGLYWELAYLGLAQGDTLTHVLEHALEHLDRAMEYYKESGPMNFQRGRILMRLKRWEESQRCIQLALQQGANPNDVLPYQAEVAFHLRRYEDLRFLLGALSPAARSHAPLRQVAQYWL